MTETDASNRPLKMPERFMPYLDRYRIYLLFKQMTSELIIAQPKDHLRFMKMFITRTKSTPKDTDRVLLLISPEINVDAQKLVKEIVKSLGLYVLTRRFIVDRYEKHDDFQPGCVSPALLSEVTKSLTLREHVQSAGWLMFDHPCSFREARCLQQDGVLPTVTLVLMPTPKPAPPAHDAQTSQRGFFQQDFEGLKFAYKATLKEVHLDSGTSIDVVAERCVNAVRACAAGAQGSGQGFHVVGAPGVYRVLVIGPRGSGRRTQARLLANHFDLVYLYYADLISEAKAKDDEISKKLRTCGESAQLKAEIIERRLLMKDCIDHGWALTGYPLSGAEFEAIDNMRTPPNRVIFLNVDWPTCKTRAISVGVDCCTGKRVPLGSGPRVVAYPNYSEAQIDAELDYYYTEALAEMRAAAGMTGVEINATDSTIDETQTKIQAAVIASPYFNMEILLIIRTLKSKLGQLIECVKLNSPYNDEEMDLAAVVIDDVNKTYLNWTRKVTAEENK